MISSSLLTISGTYSADFGYSTAFSIEEDATDAYGYYEMSFNIADVFTYTIDVSVTHTPDVLVTSVDLITAVDNLLGGTFTLADWVPTTSSQWALQEDSDVAITDSYLAYNFAEDFLGLTTEWYYGTQEYFSYELSL
ncbi:hypothetical protein FGO68_gene1841 [Halteria grandinella]|uniref:Uncharacterized protein n=1 Tax=Halteria grandinella TaxID=5974 RepID=A0A8J8NM78_HALGN|nr:hypothetical protein FGO68_gene1841 [Halteria grandinella]